MKATLSHRVKNEVGWSIATLVLGLVLFLPNLGNHGLWARDEPREAEIAREMWQSGDWLLPQLNGEPFLEKPPLFYWGVSLSLWWSGEPTAACVRLPAALLATATLLLTAYAGRLLAGPLVGFLAALLLATSARFFTNATTCRVDIALVFTLTLTMVLYLRVRALPKPRWYQVWPIYLAAGLTFLAKGPSGLVFVIAVLSVDVLAHRGWFGWWRLYPLSGLVVLSLPVGLWSLATYFVHGSTPVRILVWDQTWNRFFGQEAHHLEPWYHYLQYGVVDLMPWTPILALTLVHALYRLNKRWNDGEMASIPRSGEFFLWLWAGLPLLLLHLSASKRGLYLLPLYPVFALLMALWLQRWFIEGTIAARWGVSYKPMSNAVCIYPGYPETGGAQWIGYHGLKIALAGVAITLIPITHICAPSWLPLGVVLSLGLSIWIIVYFPTPHRPLRFIAALAIALVVLYLAGSLMLYPYFDGRAGKRTRSLDPLCDRIKEARGDTELALTRSLSEVYRSILPFAWRRSISCLDERECVAYLVGGKGRSVLVSDTQWEKIRSTLPSSCVALPIAGWRSDVLYLIRHD